MTPSQLVIYLLFLAAAGGVVVGWWSFFKCPTFFNAFINMAVCFGISAVCVWLAYLLS